MTPDQHAARRADIEAEENRLTFDRFDFAQAWAIGQALVAAAPAPVAIRIVVGGRVLFAAALDGTCASNDAWLDLKFAALAHFGRSTLWLHHDLRARERTLAANPSVQRPMADHGGVFPIRIGAQMVGGIGVSGLPHEADHALIVGVLDQLAQAAHGQPQR